MKILVISLLRLGDIIMTVPALQGIKKQYPAARIDILMNQQFASVVPLIDGLGKVHFFDRKRLQESLADVDTPIFDAYDQLSLLVNRLNNESYDRVINLTHNPLSGWMTSLINSREKLGLCFSRRGQAAFGSPWFRYLNDYVAAGGREVFHHCDLFYYGSGLEGTPGPIELRETSRGMLEAEQIVQGDRNYILVQPLTSEEKKNWGEDRFAEALSEFQMLNPETSVFLLGAPFEEEALNRCAETCREKGVKVHIAICSLDGALSLLQRARLLITGDTAIKHLACATEVPVVEISVGSSDYRKTGVYKEGSVVVQSRVGCAPCSHSRPCHQKEFICHQQVSPEVVALTANHLMKKQYDQIRIISEEYKDQAEILMTHISKSGFWVAQPADKDMSEWTVNRWLDHVAWKMLLQKEHLKPVGAYGTEGGRLKKLIEGLRLSASRESWFLILDHIEKEARRIEGEIHWLRGVLHKSVRKADDASRFENWLAELRRFYETNQGDNVLVAHILNQGQGYKAGEPLNIQNLRKAQIFINDVYNRTQIKIKLIRSLRSEVMESSL